MAAATPTLDAVAGTMLSALSSLLPTPTNGLPAPNVIMVTLRERSAGLGRHIGNSAVADFSVVALKGIRLEGVAQFQLWAASPADVDTTIANLNSRVLANRDSLWQQGFLKMALKDARPAQNIPAVGWRRSADYSVLYEFPYQDTEDADSLIARIPIAIDSGFNESTLVTDRMTRWDNQSAPALAVRGRLGITSLSALSFIAAAPPAGSVTLTRTFDGAQGPPSPHATMTDFLGHIAGDAPAERHASITFASLTAFLAALNPAGGPITMGDLDQNNVPDQYLARALSVQPPIQLAGVADRFEIAFQNPAFNSVAVVYLRLARSVTG
jgi:hypothetical protein